MGLALAAKICPYQPKAFKKVNNIEPFFGGITLFFFIFALNEPVPGTLKAFFCKKVSRYYPKN